MTKILEILKYKIFKTSTGSIRQLISLGDSLGISDDFIPKFGLRKIRGDWLADYYKDMMIQEVASTSTEQNSLGLAQMLYEQMKRNYNL